MMLRAKSGDKHAHTGIPMRMFKQHRCYKYVIVKKQTYETR